MERGQKAAATFIALFAFALFFAWVGKASAQYDYVRCDRTDIPEGAPSSACTGSMTNVPGWDVDEGHLIIVCRGASIQFYSDVEADCPANDGTYTLTFPSTLQLTDMVCISVGGCAWEPVARFQVPVGYACEDCGGGGGEGGSFTTLADLGIPSWTPEQWGEVVSALLGLLVTLACIAALKKYLL